jgi:hypothetical protein
MFHFYVVREKCVTYDGGAEARHGPYLCLPAVRLRGKMCQMIDERLWRDTNFDHVPAQERYAMKPRAVLWDLFGDHLRYVGDGQIPMQALSRLLEVFGVGDSTARVVLARMRRERWFETYRNGRQSS